MHKLVIVDESGVTFSALLDSEVLTIGREAANGLHLDERNVSRRHAQLRRSHDGYELSDLGSSNGTFINQARVADVVSVREGDVIQVGDFEMRLEVVAIERTGAGDERFATDFDSNEVTEVSDFAHFGWSLLMRRGPTPGAIFPLHAESLRIGRSSEADVRVRDASVSRMHCEVQAQRDRVVVVDIGSANGLRINGAVATRATLELGDMLELGDVRFELLRGVTDDALPTHVPAQASTQASAAYVPRSVPPVLKVRDKDSIPPAATPSRIPAPEVTALPSERFIETRSVPALRRRNPGLAVVLGAAAVLLLYVGTRSWWSSKRDAGVVASTNAFDEPSVVPVDDLNDDSNDEVLDDAVGTSPPLDDAPVVDPAPRTVVVQAQEIDLSRPPPVSAPAAARGEVVELTDLAVVAAPQQAPTVVPREEALPLRRVELSGTAVPVPRARAKASAEGAKASAEGAGAKSVDARPLFDVRRLPAANESNRTPSADPPPEKIAYSEREVLADVTECQAKRSQRCVIDVLTGRAKTSRTLGLLIDAYHDTGEGERAHHLMQIFVDRYSNHPFVPRYQRLLNK